MKTVIYYHTATGEIASVSQVPDGIDIPSLPGLSSLLNTDEIPVMSGEYFVKDGALCKRSPRPSMHHEWDGAKWVPDIDRMARAARRDRDERLAASDWTQIPDVPLATKEAWAAYRQALRDVTEQPGFPTEITWPEIPE